MVSFRQATNRRSEDFRQATFSCINSMKISQNFLLYRSMGLSMQCLLCGRRSASSGQNFLRLFQQMAPSVVNVFVRGVVLFILGVFFAMVLFMFSVLPEARRKRIQALDFGIIANLFSAVWWIAPSSGTVAAVVGIIYPCSDIRLGKPHKLQREWSSVAKCVVLFLGISHACAVSFLSLSSYLDVILSASRATLMSECPSVIVSHSTILYFISGCFQAKKQT